MQKPKCRICGVRHWSHEPHRWTKEPAQTPDAEPVMVAHQGPVAASVIEEDPTVKPESVTKRLWRQRNRARYNAYMKDYMSEYRKREK